MQIDITQAHCPNLLSLYNIPDESISELYDLSVILAHVQVIGTINNVNIIKPGNAFSAIIRNNDPIKPTVFRSLFIPFILQRYTFFLNIKNFIDIIF